GAEYRARLAAGLRLFDEGPRQVWPRRLEEPEAEIHAPDRDRGLAQRPVEIPEEPRLGDVDVGARQPGLVEVRGPIDGRGELGELPERRRVIGLPRIARRRGIERAVGELRFERDDLVGGFGGSGPIGAAERQERGDMLTVDVAVLAGARNAEAPRGDVQD